MAVYNGETYLRLAVDSILAQTFTDFEFIIIDDGSTDNTATILDSYNDERIVRIKNETNLGLVETLNKGLKLARGKYIARMDADDIARPQRLELQVKYLESHPEIGLLGTRYRIIDDEGNNVFDTVSPPPFIPGTVTTLNWMILWETAVQHPTAMMRRELIEAHDLRYDAHYFTAEDYDLWTRIHRLSGVARIDEDCLQYRVNPEGISSTKRRKQLETHFQITYREVCAYMGETLPEDLMRLVFRVVIQHPFDSLDIINTTSVADSIDLFLRIRQRYLDNNQLTPDEHHYIQIETRRILLKFLVFSRHKDHQERNHVRLRILRQMPLLFVRLGFEFIALRIKRILGIAD